MKKNKIITNRGLVRGIILIIIALLLLAYFGFNLRSIVSSPTFVDNWDFLKTLCLNIWNNYLKAPSGFIWDKVFIPYVWEPVVNNISNSRS